MWVNEEGVGVIGRREHLSAGGVGRGPVLLLEGQKHGVGYLGQAAAAAPGDGAVDVGGDEDTLVGAHELDAAHKLGGGLVAGKGAPLPDVVANGRAYRLAQQLACSKFHGNLPSKILEVALSGGLH